jgi:pilus assembly protein Flp/PilA
METWAAKIRRFLVADNGPTAIEYAVMLALIFMVCLVAINLFGTRTNATFQNAAQSIEAAESAAGS